MITSGLIDITPGFGENVGSVFQKGPNFNSIRSPGVDILFRGDLEDQTPLPVLRNSSELLLDQSSIGTDMDGRFERLVGRKRSQITTGEVDHKFSGPGRFPLGCAGSRHPAGRRTTTTV